MDADFQVVEEDPYGPGSDLMISLFSVAILLLGIVGAGEQFSRVEQASILRSQAPVTVTPQTGGDTEIPPLLLASRAQLSTLERNLGDRDKALAALTAEHERLSREYRDQASRLDDKTRSLDSANAALLEAQNRLEDVQRRRETARNKLDLTSFSIPAEKLAGFFDDPKRIRLTIGNDSLKRMAENALPLPDDMNRIVIETRLPPELLALVPVTDDPQAVFRDFFFLSTGLAEAYRVAMADAGFPLACLTLDAGSFEEAAAMRRKIMVENLGATDAFSEVATLFRNTPAAVAAATEADVRIRLAGDADSRCDRQLLSTLLSSFQG